MANRLTFHAGYRNQMGKAYNSKHIQREGFQKEQDGDTQPPKNVYWNYAVKVAGADFSKSEKLFYKSWIGPHIDRHNKKADDRRQYGRKLTVEQYKEKHPPEEVLLYLGTKNVDVAALEAVFRDFVGWLGTDCWDKEKGGVRPLGAALHLDETTPHIHLRQAWLYKDKEGDWQVSQNKALDVLGYKRPDLSKPVGKWNNAKMTFTTACRKKLFELAEQYGVELETEPLPKDEVGLPFKEYKQREQAREAAAKKQQAAQQRIDELNAEIADKTTEIEELTEEKDEVQGELKRSRESYSREQAALKKKRQEVLEQAQKEAEKILETARKQGDELRVAAIQEGANSAMGQLMAMRRAEQQKEQEEQEQWQRDV